MDIKIPDFVSTYAEAEEIIKAQQHFRIGLCSCRKGRGKCGHSRPDVCLSFSEQIDFPEGESRAVKLADALELVSYAREKHLVARPCWSLDVEGKMAGICFCCPDCCRFFTLNDKPCQKGAFIESTEIDNCLHCGQCVEICYFGARKLDHGRLAIDRECCFGCGLCAAPCPVGCITMAKRTQAPEIL
ncbi:MAG: hypothetical protein PHW04_13120 [Candidatus Wallbacteria bacterium]|nr:hypothetical protein [Candidatus Wallbacteria bacterium]